jgi:uncharacterized protein (TIGR02266 family)
MASGVHLRRSGRVEATIGVQVTAGLQTFAAKSANVGDGGLFLVAERFGRVGEELSLSFRLPGDDEAINVRAEVRWIRQDVFGEDRRPSGMGLRFLDLSPNDGVGLRHFIRSIEALG